MFSPPGWLSVSFVCVPAPLFILRLVWPAIQSDDMSCMRASACDSCRDEGTCACYRSMCVCVYIYIYI
jgi:hypothetical protein